MSYAEAVSPACTVEGCRKCSGEECDACIGEPRKPGARCLRHDAVERHNAHPKIPRTLTPTLPLERPIERIEVSFDDPEACARVFERIAMLIRAHGSLFIG